MRARCGCRLVPVGCVHSSGWFTCGHAYDAGVETALRLVRTAKLLAHEPSVPKWLRGLFVFGLLPIPLFFDELALIVATALLYVSHRQVVIEAWSRAGVDRFGP